MIGPFDNNCAILVEEKANWIQRDSPFWQIKIDMRARAKSWCLWKPFGHRGVLGKVYQVKIRDDGHTIHGHFEITHSGLNHMGQFTVKSSTDDSTFGLKEGNFWVDLNTDYSQGQVGVQGYNRRYRTHNSANCKWLRAPEHGGTAFDVKIKSFNYSKTVAAASIAKLAVRNRNTRVLREYDMAIAGLTAGAGTPTYTPGSWSSLPELDRPVNDWMGTVVTMVTGPGAVALRLGDKTTFEFPTGETTKVRSWYAIELGGYVAAGSAVKGIVGKKTH